MDFIKKDALLQTKFCVAKRIGLPVILPRHHDIVILPAEGFSVASKNKIGSQRRACLHENLFYFCVPRTVNPDNVFVAYLVS